MSSQKPDYDCDGNCLAMPTATVYATNLKWQDAPMQLPVTMTLMLPMTTAAVPNSTSAACAAVTASPKARATAKATDPEAGYDCEGNCLNDADGDGVCDEFEVAGCTDATCNYDADATDDDGSCAQLDECGVWR